MCGRGGGGGGGGGVGWGGGARFADFISFLLNIPYENEII